MGTVTAQHVATETVAPVARDPEGQDNVSEMNIFTKERRHVTLEGRVLDGVRVEGLDVAIDGLLEPKRVIECDYIVASESRWLECEESLEPGWSVKHQENGLVTAQRTVG